MTSSSRLSLRPADAPLAQAEAEMTGLESRLAEAVARTEATRMELVQRLTQLRERARRARQEHEGQDEVSAAAESVEAAVLPVLEAGDLRDEALKARECALELRRAALRDGEDGLRRFQERSRAMTQALESAEARLALAVRTAQARAARSRAIRQTPTPREARSAVNRRARVPMQASVELRSTGTTFTGFSANLSKGGLFVATPVQVPHGTPVEVSFTLPGGPSVRLPGVVRWSREVNDRTPELMPGLGVEFTELPRALAEAIDVFVGTREPVGLAV